jgi:signal transduction histidine kinase
MKKFPENRRYALIIGIVILISTATIIGLNYFSIRTLSAIRAYAKVESEYSKSQKDASGLLISYLNSNNKEYYQKFSAEIAIPIGDSMARAGLKLNLADSKIAQGFLQGRNQSADINDMIWLFRKFSKSSYFVKSIHEWEAADVFIGQLHEVGFAIRRENVLQTLTPQRRAGYLAQIEKVNNSLNNHLALFSEILAEAFRVISSMLLYLNITFIIVILGSAGWFVSGLIQQLVDSQKLISHQNMVKDEFMSIASHELKTPITSMKASLQILQRIALGSDGNSSMRPFVNSANKQVNRLTDLVNELLDVTRIQSGRLILDKELTPLHELVKDTVQEMQHLSHHIYTIQKLPDVTVNVDSKRIRQVIINLLTNAAKFSPGSTNIVIGLEKDRDNVKLFVQDYGIGIPKTKLPLIFERFYRVEDNGNIVQGLGLGLYICSGIIKSHFGKIGCDSSPEEGSTFWFSLPMVKVQQTSIV